jgi:tRNA pseudouridine13 synthase
MRATPEDFVVEEILGYVTDGEGEHAFLVVEKRGHQTQWVARELARFADISPVGIGFAGLKDRHAVTRQAFSVHLPGRTDPDWSVFPKEGVRIVSSTRHQRKLKRGALAGNRFTLTLRDVRGDHEAAERVLAALRDHGVPNYFGEQRFGRGGTNVERARAMFAGKRADKRTRSMLLSAARSQLFNEVLAGRVEDGCWDTPLDGEIWALAGSRSWFGPEPYEDTLAQRLVRGDIHPSGPLWGKGEPPTTAEAAARERAVAEAAPELVAGLIAAGMDQQRRALRLMPQDLAWDWRDDTTLELRFALPAGSYATVVVRELAETT